jgi:CxxC-x17-CxxC domain-containing protein
MPPTRRMFEGNWTCAECGVAITELPFEPRSGQPITCKACHIASKPERPSFGGRGGSRQGSFGGQRRDSRGPRPERVMVAGNWNCKDCGDAITELPFEPRDPQNVSCRSCFQR